MTFPFAALLSLTPFARDVPPAGTLCTDCLPEDLREELAALAWGSDQADEPDPPPPGTYF